MSLRQEIQELLVFETFNDQTKAELFTNQILKKFEKRIDEMIKEEGEILHLCVETDRRDAYPHSSYIATINTLKRVKEILK